MSVRQDAPDGAPIWVELFTSDTPKAVAFYRDLFGWEAEEPRAEFGGYFNFSKDGVLVAGGYHNDGANGMPDLWSVYLATSDATKTAELVTGHGGSTIVEPMAVMELGTMAVYTDPGGASIGAWQPGTHRGFGLYRQPGTPNWFELHTRDYDAAVAFYRDAFAWPVSTMSDTEEFRYSTYGEGDTAEAGIMDASSFLPDGVPAHWSIYFEVEDTDAALVRVAELGGSVVLPAEDTPYGRLAQVADPTGAMFKLMQPPAG